MSSFVIIGLGISSHLSCSEQLCNRRTWNLMQSSHAVLMRGQFIASSTVSKSQAEYNRLSKARAVEWLASRVCRLLVKELIHCCPEIYQPEQRHYKDIQVLQSSNILSKNKSTHTALKFQALVRSTSLRRLLWRNSFWPLRFLSTKMSQTFLSVKSS